jgi:selT/selW/selH-like putative selenoprotein
MNFEIRYCKPCGYRKRAEDLAAELRERFGAHVSVEEGRFGQFDVWMGEYLVASKGRTFLRRMLSHGTPSQSELIEAIERHLAVRAGDTCEVPATDES